MATKEKLRERVLRRDHYICQFPNFYEGFVCASSKNVVVHAIEPTNWAAANFLDFEKIPLDQKNAPDTLKLLKIIQEIRANPQKAFNYQELFFNVGLLS